MILVLLIIFIVAAPLSTVDVNVDLPVSTAAPAPRNEKPLFLSVKADLGLALGENPIARDALQSALDSATQSDREQRIYVRSDKTVPYGDVMEVMNLLRAAGYLKIGLVGLDGGQTASNGTLPTESAAAPVSGVAPK